jgi:hypothetical protein
VPYQKLGIEAIANVNTKGLPTITAANYVSRERYVPQYADNDSNMHKPLKPWVGRDKHFGNDGVPKVRFWADQQVIENAEYAEEEARKAESAV